MALFDWFPKAKSGAPQNTSALEGIARRLTELENRVESLDHRLTVVEEQVRSTLDHFGDYKNRTERELKLMRVQIDDLLATAEALVQRAEDREHQMRAQRLVRRLKNNRTRIQKAVERLAIG